MSQMPIVDVVARGSLVVLAASLHEISQVVRAAAAVLLPTADHREVVALVRARARPTAGAASVAAPSKAVLFKRLRHASRWRAVPWLRLSRAIPGESVPWTDLSISFSARCEVKRTPLDRLPARDPPRPRARSESHARRASNEGRRRVLRARRESTSPDGSRRGIRRLGSSGQFATSWAGPASASSARTIAPPRRASAVRA
jgi:hypothetical protein